MFPESTEGQTFHDPIAEQKARTIEAIKAMLPIALKDIDCCCEPFFLYDDKGPRHHVCGQGFNSCRSEVIALLPQIIAEVEKRKVEEIREMIEKERDQNYFRTCEDVCNSILSKLP